MSTKTIEAQIWEPFEEGEAEIDEMEEEGWTAEDVPFYEAERMFAIKEKFSGHRGNCR